MNSFLQGPAPNYLEPLLLKMSAMVPPSPHPSAVPAMWKYQEMVPHLELAVKLVPTEQAERRVLILVNPKMGEWRHICIRIPACTCIRCGTVEGNGPFLGLRRPTDAGATTQWFSAVRRPSALSNDTNFPYEMEAAAVFQVAFSC